MTFLEANDVLDYFSVTTGGKNFKASHLEFFLALYLFSTLIKMKNSVFFVNIEMYAVCISSWEHYTVAHKSV